MARKNLSQVTRPHINAQGRLLGYWTDTYSVDQPDPVPTPAPVPPRITTAVAPPRPRRPETIDLTMKQLFGLVMMHITHNVPSLPDTLGDAVKIQQARGQR